MGGIVNIDDSTPSDAPKHLPVGMKKTTVQHTLSGTPNEQVPPWKAEKTHLQNIHDNNPWKRPNLEEHIAHTRWEESKVARPTPFIQKSVDTLVSM